MSQPVPSSHILFLLPHLFPWYPLFKLHLDLLRFRVWFPPFFGGVEDKESPTVSQAFPFSESDLGATTWPGGTLNCLGNQTNLAIVEDQG